MFEPWFDELPFNTVTPCMKAFMLGEAVVLGLVIVCIVLLEI